MKIRKEIEKFADEEDKEILRWLFDRYHWESQWYFVTNCRFERYGTESYKLNRIWKPTKEGYILYTGMKDE